MAEAVRLVVWDLDETFWKGTITEGGMTDYIQSHHDTVIELARRGIISSICSKNDEAPTLAVLREKGIADYFVFPSITWDPKGPRLAALIKAVQLRAPTVMFIDDNPGNRAEAAAMVPGLQVEDETFVARMLDDPRFRGRDDATLTRLAHYKLLEKRKRDEKHAAGDTTAFLRGCDIRVYIEYDVAGHIDRAIELINRTNQLNFTKRRLPENMDEARAELTKQLSPFRASAGLVKVFDRYGDYGFVGFYLLHGDPPVAAQFCFSCRTLGMLVEKWLYDRLGQPRLKVAGEVLTDLFAPRKVDWITIAASPSPDAALVVPVAPEIRVHGGCEAQPLAHYLRAHSPSVKVTGTMPAGGVVVSTNATPLLLSACGRHGPALACEAEALGIPYDLLVSDYFAAVPPGTAFVFAGGSDGYKRIRYRHRRHGWEIRADPEGLQRFNVFEHTGAELEAKLDQFVRPGVHREQAGRFARHVKAQYDPVAGETEADVETHTRALLDRIPPGSKLVLILDSPRIRVRGDALHIWAPRRAYNLQIARLLANCPFAAALGFDDCIHAEEEIFQGGNHFDRKVYFRMAEAILDALRGLRPKPPPITAEPGAGF
jgi:FkbH-like protein